MEEKIEFNTAKYNLVLIFFIAVLIACIYSGYRILIISFVIEPNTDDDGWMLIFPITIVFIEFFIALISWLNRKLSGKEVFKISDKGLEDIYCNLNFMIFFVMLSAELIPWSAINEFKIFTWTGGRKYVVAVINEDRLSPRTLKLFKLKAGNSSFGLMKGLYFGSRNAKMSADELIKILKQYQQKYTK